MSVEQDLVEAWNGQYGGRSVPVFVGDDHDDDCVEFTHQQAWLGGKPEDEQRTPMIRVGSSWKPTDLRRITVHPRAAEAFGLKPIEPVELSFRAPDCEFCEIELSHDGDSFYCEQCCASWSDNGFRMTRKCVEDECGGDEADTLGDDGQPRCQPCAFLVTIGVLEPTGPYKCRETYCGNDKVTGMPFDAKARQSRRCGRCQSRAESDAWWADYQAGKKS